MRAVRPDPLFSLVRAGLGDDHVLTECRAPGRLRARPGRAGSRDWRGREGRRFHFIMKGGMSVIVTAGNHGRLWRSRPGGFSSRWRFFCLAACSRGRAALREAAHPRGGRGRGGHAVGESLVYSASLIPNEPWNWPSRSAVTSGTSPRPRARTAGPHPAKGRQGRPGHGPGGLRDDDYQAALRRPRPPGTRTWPRCAEGPGQLRSATRPFSVRRSWPEANTTRPRKNSTTTRPPWTGLPTRSRRPASSSGYGPQIPPRRPGPVPVHRKRHPGRLRTLAFVLADLSTVKAVFGVPDFMLRFITPGGRRAGHRGGPGKRGLPGTVLAVAPRPIPKAGSSTWWCAS
jgi:hypothetical protein